MLGAEGAVYWVFHAEYWVPVQTGTQEVGTQVRQLAKSSSDRAYRQVGVHVCAFWHRRLFPTLPWNVAALSWQKRQGPMLSFVS